MQPLAMCTAPRLFSNEKTSAIILGETYSGDDFFVVPPGLHSLRRVCIVVAPCADLSGPERRHERLYRSATRGSMKMLRRGSTTIGSGSTTRRLGSM